MNTSNIRTDYTHTIYASYIGYITQAIVNNFAPLLFIHFMNEYAFTLRQITLITTINFIVQLLVDLISAKTIDKAGYRRSVMAAHVFAAAGLIGLTVLPEILPAYAGLLISVVLYAVGGGIIEVLISPIVESCPTKKKEAAMALLHSFYCWGHLGVVLFSTLFFAFAGIRRWRILALLFAAVPLFNLIYFSMVPIYPIVKEGKGMSITQLLKNGFFWLLFIMMICAGASEQAMSQWSSAFAESALHVSKTAGDLAGPSAFALFMGTARALYGKYSEKFPLLKTMIASSLLCIFCYLTAVFAEMPALGLLGCAVCGFSVGILWPGTFSLAAKGLPAGGTAMYALLALAGDVGCSSGPTTVGMISSLFSGNLKAGLTAAVIFPVLMMSGSMIALKLTGKQKESI